MFPWKSYIYFSIIDDDIFHCKSVILENEPQEHTKADRLSSLHSRLHQEAEKIRKWKTQTEIDLKQKVA